MITFITGPMFSGKSSELCKQIERKHYAGKKTCLIRPLKDTREFVARGWSNESLEEITDIIRLEDFEGMENLLDSYDALFVDEYWMFKNLKTLCLNLPKNSGHKCDVFFSGILCNIEQKLWPNAIEILPHCDEIIKLNAVCSECGSEHSNYSYLESKKEGMEKDISKGVGDLGYKTLCRKCLLKHL